MAMEHLMRVGEIINENEMVAETTIIHEKSVDLQFSTSGVKLIPSDRV